MTDKLISKLDEILKRCDKATGAPYVCTDTSADRCLVEMLNTHPKLYNDCLHAIGFAFQFNQLANRAVKYDQICTDLPRVIKALKEALRGFGICREEIRRLYPTMSEEQFNRAFDKLVGIKEIERELLGDGD